MAKNPANLTEEELKAVIQLESGSKAAEIAEGVFKKLFDDEKEKWDGKVSKIVYGVIIAVILLFIALFVSTWLFMGTYQQHYLNTQAAFNEKFNELIKENADLKIDLSGDVEQLKEKQDYVERILMENK
jgi:type II secretory pathway component PulL